MEPWSMSDFSNGIIEETRHISSSFYWVSEDFNFTLQSSGLGVKHQEVKIYITTWEGSDCLPQEYITSIVQNSFVDVFILTPYFDFNDIENPIKYQLTESQYMILDSSYYYILTYIYSRNVVIASV